jgi:hypothetical protein
MKWRRQEEPASGCQNRVELQNLSRAGHNTDVKFSNSDDHSTLEQLNDFQGITRIN